MPKSPFIPDLLRCPHCGADMPRLTAAAADAWRCSGCGGVWLAAGAERILRDQADEIDPSAPSAVPTGLAARGDRCCPACDGHYALLEMVDPAQPHIHFESCKFCYGRFFDAGEFQDLSEETLLERLRALRDTLRINLASAG